MPTHEEKAGFAQRHDITTKQVRVFRRGSAEISWEGTVHGGRGAEGGTVIQHECMIQGVAVCRWLVFLVDAVKTIW